MVPKTTGVDGVELYRTLQIGAREVVFNLGMVVATARYLEGAMRDEAAVPRAENALNACAAKLALRAGARGANAVIGLSLDPGGYQASGASYNTHILYMSGDAVILSDP